MAGSNTVPEHDSMHAKASLYPGSSLYALPEDPFGPTPFKDGHRSMHAQPTYPCFPGQICIGVPPPATAAPPFRRSLLFNELPKSHLPSHNPPSAFASGPLITTPQGVCLNPAFRVG